MSLGIFDLIALAGTLIFALPVAIFGLEQVAAGRPTVGVLLVAVAVLMVVLPQKLTTPGDVPAAIAERVFGSVLPDDPEEE